MAAFGRRVQHSKIILFLPWQMLNSPTNSRKADGSPLFHTVYENLFQLWSSSSPLLMMSLESQPRVAAAATTTSRRSGSSLSLDKVKEPPVGRRERAAQCCWPLAASERSVLGERWSLALRALLYKSATPNRK